MRRMVTLFVLACVPLLAVGQLLPGRAGFAASRPTATPVKHVKRCPKGKHRVKRAHGKVVCVRIHAKPKPTPTPTPRPHKRKKPVHTPTPTATASPTASDTPTSTPTLTPTPAPYVNTITVSLATMPGSRVAFVACALPPGVSASFSPSIAVGVPASQKPYYGVATATLTLTTANPAPAQQDDLAINALIESGNGGSVPAAMQNLSPPAVHLSIPAGGSPTVTPSQAQVPTIGTTCSTLPPGFLPTATPVPLPQDVSVTASVAPQNPAPNSLVTVTGTITLRGKPVAGVPMVAKWYTQYGIKECEGVTDNTGTVSCSIVNLSPWLGFVVDVQTIFNFIGQDFYAYANYIE